MLKLTDETKIAAISLHQPWATLIARGHKEYETRSWYTNYRGPLLICAAQKRFSRVFYDRLSTDLFDDPLKLQPEDCPRVWRSLIALWVVVLKWLKISLENRVRKSYWLVIGSQATMPGSWITLVRLAFVQLKAFPLRDSKEYFIWMLGLVQE